MLYDSGISDVSCPTKTKQQLTNILNALYSNLLGSYRVHICTMEVTSKINMAMQIKKISKLS